MDAYTRAASRKSSGIIARFSLAVIAALIASLFLTRDSLAIFVTRKLSGVMPEGWGIGEMLEISPDGQYAVYTRGTMVSSTSYASVLFSVPLDGGEPVPLSPEVNELARIG